MKKTIATTIISAMTLFASADVQTAKVSDKLKALWDDPVLQEQLDTGIKANRMSDFFLKFIVKQERFKYNDIKVSDLKVEQIKHDFLFGCNAFLIDAFRNKDGTKNQSECDKYGEVFSKVFNFATLSFYWKDIEPQKNKWRFDKDSEFIYRRPAGDVSVEFCKKYNLVMKGHCLVWNVNKGWGQPDWATLKRDEEAFKTAQMRNIREIAKRYGEDIKIWDVVNESGSYRQGTSMQYNDYVYESFKEAERVFPRETILINNETDQAFTQLNKDDYTGRFFQTNNYLIAKGAKLDALGVQYHVFSERRWENILAGKIETPEFFLNALDLLAKQNRPIHITEITIPSMGEHGEDNQAYWIEKLYTLWFSHPKVEAITWWNLVDGMAAGGEDKWKGGIVNRNFSPKKAYQVLDNLINKKWRTNVEFKGENNRVHFRGFYGTYKLTYKYKGKTVSQTVRLSKGMRECLVELPQ
ncbi:MAG: endo-1,4-beta-xylanase [Opitutales bacterium]|nr:endo-1,4-beta-xylanase [Opitutales bacterium]